MHPCKSAENAARHRVVGSKACSLNNVIGSFTSAPTSWRYAEVVPSGSADVEAQGIRRVGGLPPMSTQLSVRREVLTCVCDRSDKGRFAGSHWIGDHCCAFDDHDGHWSRQPSPVDHSWPAEYHNHDNPVVCSAFESGASGRICFGHVDRLRNCWRVP